MTLYSYSVYTDILHGPEIPPQSIRSTSIAADSPSATNSFSFHEELKALALAPEFDKTLGLI